MMHQEETTDIDLRTESCMICGDDVSITDMEQHLQEEHSIG